MRHASLAELFQCGSRPARELAVVWRRGYRTERWMYRALLENAWQFARELEERAIARGERILLWGEGCGEWLAVFLGCMLRGVVVVPMDPTATPEFASHVATQADVKLAVTSRTAPQLAASIPTFVLEDLCSRVARHPARPPAWPQLSRSDILEIVFTSGTTSEPRGVVLTHGNLLANLEPLESEIEKYRRYERFVHPLRFLNLLPLSHVFGQMMGIFIPQLIGGTVFFLETLRPAEIVRAIRREHVSVLVTVPRLVESLREKIERDLAAEGGSELFRKNFEAAANERFWWRWWRFRKIHRTFGWRFWAFISGGATLPAELDEFWTRLGFAVIQGYGLTETTSLVSVNHPFDLGKGSIGKTLPGMDVKLDASGEILVRGEAVAAGYWQGRRLVPVESEEGWFRTGDLGQRNVQGRLFFRGRSKSVIVTSEGMKVHPEDLEAALRKDPRVRDCVVLGRERTGNAEPCAVLLLAGNSGAGTAEDIVHRANQSLASHQQIRSWFVWPEPDFPRTPTQKPLLPRIRAAIEADESAMSGRGSVEGLLDRLSHAAPKAVPSSAGLSADLNLSSVERVELLGELEERYQTDLDEASFAQAATVGDLERMLREPASLQAARFPFPRWPLRWPVTWLRTIVYYLLVWPATVIHAWPRVIGRENLRRVRAPFLIISNHVTPEFDIGFILKALPPRLRMRLAIAMGGERLRGLRYPPAEMNFFARALERIRYFLVVALFNVFPLPKQSGFRESFSFAGELADRGWSILVFPEGETTKDGKIAPFRTGIGLLVSRLNLPVVPFRIEGLYELQVAGKRFSPPGRVKVFLGPPLQFDAGADPAAITRELEQRVSGLAYDSGAS